nr:terminase gpA endonuclease subunit [Roseibium aquae]
MHLPSWSDSEWLKQLTAEQLVTVKGKRGFTRLEWGLSRILCFGS